MSRRDIAVVYAGMGKKDRAFEWLIKSCQDQDVELATLKADLEVDSLRSDPRFRDIVQCAGFRE